MGLSVGGLVGRSTNCAKRGKGKGRSGESFSPSGRARATALGELLPAADVDCKPPAVEVNLLIRCWLLLFLFIVVVGVERHGNSASGREGARFGREGATLVAKERLFGREGARFRDQRT